MEIGGQRKWFASEWMENGSKKADSDVIMNFIVNAEQIDESESGAKESLEKSMNPPGQVSSSRHLPVRMARGNTRKWK